MKKLVNTRLGAVVAGASVLVVLGGTGAAVASDLIGSRGIADNSVRSVDVRDNTIRKADLTDAVRAELALRAQDGVDGVNGVDGKDGVNGVDGKDGKDGAPGLANVESDGPYPGATKLQDGDNSTLMWKAGTPDQLQSSWVQCAPGKVAIGGGFSRADEGPAAFKGLQVVTSSPTQIAGGEQVYTPIEGDVDGSFLPNAWLVEGFNTGTTDLIVRPHVVCATVAR